MPAYRQVADDVRAKINAGEYGPGEQLPSERDMVDTYGVSRPTIRDAIGLLRGQGIVTAEHGKGVFVRRVPPVTRLGVDRLSRAKREANQAAFLGEAAAGGFRATSAVQVYFEPADVRIADLLGVEPGTEVCVRPSVGALYRDGGRAHADTRGDVRLAAHGRHPGHHGDQGRLHDDRFELVYEIPAD